MDAVCVLSAEVCLMCGRPCPEDVGSHIIPFSFHGNRFQEIGGAFENALASPSTLLDDPVLSTSLRKDATSVVSL